MFKSKAGNFAVPPPALFYLLLPELPGCMIVTLLGTLHVMWPAPQPLRDTAKRAWALVLCCFSPSQMVIYLHERPRLPQTRLCSVSNPASKNNLFGFVSPEPFDQIYHFPKDDKASELVTSVKEERRNQPITIPLVQDSASWVSHLCFPIWSPYSLTTETGICKQNWSKEKKGEEKL